MNQDDHEVVWQLIENFDFERVLSVMQQLDWQWWSESGERVPTLKQLRAHVRAQLLEAGTQARQAGHYTLSSGGFETTAEVIDNLLFVNTKFVLTNWDNY